jgi:hypothetical protein
LREAEAVDQDISGRYRTQSGFYHTVVLRENGERDMDKVIVGEVMESARRIIIRLDVGSFRVSGPRDNVLSVESPVAFATCVIELYREGFQMVAPEEYAASYGIGLESVYRKIEEEGELFLLLFREGERRDEAVPLEEKTATEGHGPHLF